MDGEAGGRPVPVRGAPLPDPDRSAGFAGETAGRSTGAFRTGGEGCAGLGAGTFRSGEDSGAGAAAPGGGAVVVATDSGGAEDRAAAGEEPAAERAMAGRAELRDDFVSAIRSFTLSTTASSRLAIWFFTSTPKPWTISMSSCGESFRSRAS